MDCTTRRAPMGVRAARVFRGHGRRPLRTVYNQAMRAFARPVITAALFAVLAACTPSTGKFDSTKRRDAGFTTIDVVTAADIGTKCVYDPATGDNPTNDCPRGLDCMIVTRDGVFNTAAMALDMWEDQYTFYRDDGLDEGYCTLIGNWDAPPFCPAGTTLKHFQNSSAACVKECVTTADCARDGYVCDLRGFGDLAFAGAEATNTCVIGCSLDYPQCMRTGTTPLQAGGAITHVAAQDLTGGSVCNLTIGICEPATHQGSFAGPGEPCVDTNDCDHGMVCIQGPLYQNGGLGTPGFCGAPCKPSTENPESCGIAGYICQAGFLFGFGDPVEPTVGNGVGLPTLDLSTLEAGEAGGWCFHTCTAGAVDTCANFPGTSCGSANQTLFGAAWNGLSMCLPAPLRQ